MKILKYLLEFILVIILGFAAILLFPSVFKFDNGLTISYLFAALEILCLFGIFGIVYRWVKGFVKR